ncbi:MAG: helix-turn-helix transcriptional regulator [Burkholderiales bacterium]|nr:helix-turn-helix transcriptional regulator [Burkholderiales bacterium]
MDPGSPQEEAERRHEFNKSALKEIGDRLVLIRGEANREEFARYLGIHPETLGRYERGLRAPDASVLLALNAVERVDPLWVLTGERQMRISSPEPALPDTELMEVVLERIEAFCKKERLTVPPKRKAKLAVLLYEHIAARGGKPASAEESFRRFLDALL